MRAIFTDLDGSLRCHRQGIHPLDHASLIRLGEQGVVRVIATGRSLYAARKVLAADFPIDFLIFSSGAGILDWRSQTLLRSLQLEQAQIQQARACLDALKLDHMLHAPVPDNHYFWYCRHSARNPDFESRLALYAGFAKALPPEPWSGAGSQILAVVDGHRTREIYQSLCHQLAELSIIRATSPLDGHSGWLEIFPHQVSKSQASAWLSRRFGWQVTMAYGNDYNDLDLLSWSDRAFVASDAPPELLSACEVVPIPSQAGFSEAVRRWLVSH